MQLYNCKHKHWTRPFRPTTRRKIMIKVKPIARCMNCGTESGLPTGFGNFLADLATMRFAYNPQEILGYIEE